MKRSESRDHVLNRQVQVRTPEDYPWKVLGQLAIDLRDCFDVEEYSQLTNIVRQRDYAGYSDLSEAWSPQCISSCPGMRVEQFYAKYQVSALLKKYQFPTDRKARVDAALEKFRAAELACLSFNQYGSRNLAMLTDPLELSCYTYAREFLSRLLGEVLPDFDRLTLWSRHGPGSNLDTKDGRISLYDKYKSWPYSCTSGALELARSAIEADERWLGALEDDYRKVHGIEPWRILDRKVFWSNVLHVVPGNRIAFVPKNARTERSIAIEPCMNLYLQLGVDGYIRRRLKRWGIDLDDQTKNQELARVGSLNWDGEDPFATLDLAAASDSISLELCYRLLPPQWYTYLIRLRSPTGTYGDETFVFEKISSMGNGYTFALESAIFAAIVYGVEKTLHGTYDKDRVAVYGDDIIVRASSVPLVVRMLNLCGFSLNPEKSFISGPFRESCGADWFNGTPVRPVFLTSKPTTVMGLWCDSNRLRRILSLRFMGFEFESTKLIDSWIPPQFNDCVGPLSDEVFDSYRHHPAPTTRYRNGLWKFNCLVARPVQLKGDSFLFRKLMHTLRGSGVPNPFQVTSWGGLRVDTGAGSRFTVTKRSSVTVSRSSSPASYWQDEYNDVTFRGASRPR